MAQATGNYLYAEHSAGSTAVISIDPVLPKQGDPFTIKITGQWRDRCIPDQREATYRFSSHDQWSIVVETVTDDDEDCSTEFEPTAFELSIPIESDDWDVFFDGKRAIDILFAVDVPNYSRRAYWEREFDLILGLHEIPPQLYSGFWISEGTPYQGILLQQQGNTVVFYELRYNRVSGEPNWHYASGEFHGNSLNGIAYLINWLSPVYGMNPEYNGFAPWFAPILVQPKEEELLFDPSSSGLKMWGINHISGFVGLANGLERAVRYSYKPWVFGLSEIQLPPVVPDMVGPWDLYGFNGQQLERSYQIEFRTGTKVGDDLYRFSSLDNEWVMDCQVDLSGEGGCNLGNERLGLGFKYTLNRDRNHEDFFYGLRFNGNYATAPLEYTNSAEPDLTGVLLRSGLHLPVLDLQ